MESKEGSGPSFEGSSGELQTMRRGRGKNQSPGGFKKQGRTVNKEKTKSVHEEGRSSLVKRTEERCKYIKGDLSF